MVVRWRAVFLGVALFVVNPLESGSQVLGTFRWQFAPYCNTVTLSVEARGATFRLEGHDDLCFGPVRAAATGTAHQNPNGTIGMAIAVARPDGIVVNHVVTLNASTLSGSWVDNFGNSGTFELSPATPSGAPRPVTVRGDFAVDFMKAGSALATGVSAISFGINLSAPPIPHLVAPGQTVANCPGTATSPQAAPGHLCVYSSLRRAVTSTCVAGTEFVCETSDRTGAFVFVLSTDSDTRVFHIGTWAVTVP
jgi:hypothetical protein